MVVMQIIIVVDQVLVQLVQKADEEQTQSSSQVKQRLIKIGVSTRGRGSGRVRGSRGFGSRK